MLVKSNKELSRGLSFEETCTRAGGGNQNDGIYQEMLKQGPEVKGLADAEMGFE